MIVSQNKETDRCMMRNKRPTKSFTRTKQSGTVLINLFKLAFIVASMKYAMVDQQHVDARQRGFIYNKDGKFIYRPPKANQGHIIVIDDRPKERAQPVIVEPGQVAAPLISGAESAYPPIQMISPRIYRPGEAAGQLQVPIRGFYPALASGQAIQLIALNDGQLPNQQPARASAQIDARNPVQAGSSPPTVAHAAETIQLIPLIPVFQTPVGGLPVAMHQRFEPAVHPGLAPAFDNGPDHADPYGSPGRGGAQNNAPKPRGYEADHLYDNPMDQEYNPSSSVFFDAPPPPSFQRANRDRNMDSKPRGFSSMIQDYEHLDDIYDVQGRSSKRKNPNDGPGLASLASFNQMQHYRTLDSKVKSGADPTGKQTRHARKKSSPNKEWKSTKPQDGIANQANPGDNNEQFSKNSQYWRQFKDQYDMVQ